MLFGHLAQGVEAFTPPLHPSTNVETPKGYVLTTRQKRIPPPMTTVPVLLIFCSRKISRVAWMGGFPPCHLWVQRVCALVPVFMNAFCAQLIPISETENDTANVNLEQLVDIVQPTIAQDLMQQGVLPRAIEKGNNLAGQRKYTIKLREWLGLAASMKEARYLEPTPRRHNHPSYDGPPA